MRNISKRRFRGFTMIEMLTVIAIMLILVSVALPIYSKIRHYQRRTKAREEIYGIHTAWTAYLQDYRRFPRAAITCMESNPAMLVLAGLLHSNLGLTYMEFSAVQWTNGYRDPWDRVYQVAIDNGLGGHDDGKENNHYVIAGGYGKIEKTVAVWSFGPDGSSENEAKQKDDVRSW